VPKRLAGASNNVKLSFFSENRQFYAEAVPKMGQNRSPPFQKAARTVSHPKHSTSHFENKKSERPPCGSRSGLVMEVTL